MRNFRSFVILAGIMLAWTGSTNAGILLAGSSVLGPVTGSGTAVASATTPTPNNYPTTTTSDNLATTVSLNTMASPLDLTINAVNSGGITQYTVSSVVVNLTGAPLTSFEFQLGTGTDGSFVPLSPSGVAFFTTPPTPTSTTFTSFTESTSALIFSGGSIPANMTSTFVYSFAVTDTAGMVGTPFSFTLREGLATVPEPASVTMLAMGVLGVGAVTLRRHRRSR